MGGRQRGTVDTRVLAVCNLRVCRPSKKNREKLIEPAQCFWPWADSGLTSLRVDSGDSIDQQSARPTPGAPPASQYLQTLADHHTAQPANWVPREYLCPVHDTASTEPLLHERMSPSWTAAAAAIAVVAADGGHRQGGCTSTPSATHTFERSGALEGCELEEATAEHARGGSAMSFDWQCCLTA
jgi:hypothetical protein